MNEEGFVVQAGYWYLVNGNAEYVCVERVD